MSDDQRNTVLLVGTVAGAVAGASSIASVATDSAAQVAIDAAERGFSPDYVPETPEEAGDDDAFLGRGNDPVSVRDWLSRTSGDGPSDVASTGSDDASIETEGDSANEVSPNSNREVIGDDLPGDSPQERWDWAQQQAKRGRGAAYDIYLMKFDEAPPNVDDVPNWGPESPDLNEPPPSEPKLVTKTSDLVTKGQNSASTPGEEPVTTGKLDNFDTRNVLDDKPQQ